MNEYADELKKTMITNKLTITPSLKADDTHLHYLWILFLQASLLNVFHLVLLQRLSIY